MLETPLDSKEIKPVNPKRNQPWIFIGRTAAQAEAPVLWLPDAMSWLTGKKKTKQNLSIALAGGLFSTEPPGKPYNYIYFSSINMPINSIGTSIRFQGKVLFWYLANLKIDLTFNSYCKFALNVFFNSPISSKPLEGVNVFQMSKQRDNLVKK